MSETPDFDENEESSVLIGKILGIVKPVLKPLVSTIESHTRISTGRFKRTECHWLYWIQISERQVVKSHIIRICVVFIILVYFRKKPYLQIEPHCHRKL